MKRRLSKDMSQTQSKNSSSSQANQSTTIAKEETNKEETNGDGDRWCSIPWVEKHRPKKIEDLILSEQILKQINAFLESGENTHLIITGDPGVGKTSTVRCLSSKFLGETIRDCFLELSSTEEYAIKNIATVIPTFCKKSVDGNGQKIILFDEIDNFTSKNQIDIGNLMKIHGKNTKFIFTCNDHTKIDSTIQSLCRIVRYTPLSKEQIGRRLIKICEIEKVSYDKSGIDAICLISEGDLRKAVNNLQLTVYTYEKVNKNNVYKICKLPDPIRIQKIINYCENNDLNNAAQEISNIFSEGYGHMDVVNVFNNVIVQNPSLKENVRLDLIKIVNDYKVVLSTTVKSNLQMYAMLCDLVKYYSDNKTK